MKVSAILLGCIACGSHPTGPAPTAAAIAIRQPGVTQATPSLASLSVGFDSGSAFKLVAFPPRNEPLAFRQQLEMVYQTQLGRDTSSTFVDLEGDVVWTQEYLRYRLSGCSHASAVQNVLAEIDGTATAPECGTVAPFPPRNEPFDFRATSLESKYRDTLRRAPTSTFVDIEGDIVWTTEYIRYRVSGCDHTTAVQFVVSQVSGNAPSPGCAPPQAVKLLLAPDTSSIKVAGAITLSAVLLLSDGSQRPVNAVWSVDTPAVASIDSSGRLRGLAAGTVVVRASFEALSADRSILVVSDFEGTWQGTYRIDVCTRLNGDGENPCRFLQGRSLPMTLIVKHTGAEDVTGTLTFFTNIGTPFEAGPITGRVNSDQTLSLKCLTAPIDVEAGHRTVSGWTTALQSANVMAGKFIGNRTAANAFGTQVTREDCTITKLQR